MMMSLAVMVAAGVTINDGAVEIVRLATPNAKHFNVVKFVQK